VEAEKRNGSAEVELHVQWHELMGERGIGQAETYYTVRRWGLHDVHTEDTEDNSMSHPVSDEVQKMGQTAWPMGVVPQGQACVVISNSVCKS